MNGFFDVYVLAPERSAKLAVDFLNHFVPRREQSAAEYCFPEYSMTPDAVFESALEAIPFCALKPNYSQAFYFRNLGTDPAHAMVLFTVDSGMILGLSVDEGKETEYLAHLKDFARASTGYIDFESAPPGTLEEFKAAAKTRKTAV
jgi:hypothetical protein